MMNTLPSQEYQGFNRKIELLNTPDSKRRSMLTSKTTKKQNQTMNPILRNLNQHTKELLYYYKIISKKPASGGLINALEDFRSYALRRPEQEVLREVRENVNLPLLPEGKNDMEEMLRFYDADVKLSNTHRNSQLLNYILSIKNYKSAEHFLYRGTLWGFENIKQ